MFSSSSIRMQFWQEARLSTRRSLKRPAMAGRAAAAARGEQRARRAVGGA